MLSLAQPCFNTANTVGTVAEPVSFLHFSLII